MARARNIKPGFFTNDDLAEVDPLGRILFIGLWTLCDREGRLEDRHRKIKAEILPYDDCDVDGLLSDLQTQGFITRYESGDSKYIQVLNFTKHQNPHIKESASTIPAPDLHSACTGNESGKHTTNPADSPFLNPESSFPQTESNQAAATSSSSIAAPVDNSPPPPPPEEKVVLRREVQYAVLIRKWEKARGKASKAASNDKRLIAWAAKGVTDSQLQEAYDLAVADREIANDNGPIVPGFIDIFIGKLLNPPAADSVLNRPGALFVAKPWQASASGVTAKGAELGVIQNAGENFAWFKERVFAAANMSAEEKSRLRADHGVHV